jgi:hypothetical protein
MPYCLNVWPSHFNRALSVGPAATEPVRESELKEEFTLKIWLKR